MKDDFVSKYISILAAIRVVVTITSVQLASWQGELPLVHDSTLKRSSRNYQRGSE